MRSGLVFVRFVLIFSGLSLMVTAVSLLYFWSLGHHDAYDIVFVLVSYGNGSAVRAWVGYLEIKTRLITRATKGRYINTKDTQLPFLFLLQCLRGCGKFCVYIVESRHYCVKAFAKTGTPDQAC